MSLLMQALKKAEDVKQKQDAAPRKEELRVEPAEGLLPMLPEAAPVADELGFPKVSPPLPDERRTEPEMPATKVEPTLDFAPAAPAMAIQRESPSATVSMPPTAAIAIEPRVNTERETGSAAKAPGNPLSGHREAQPSTEAARETAKAVFASKQRSENRRVVLIGAVLVVVIAVAGLGYYIWQGITQSSNTFPSGGVVPPAPEANPAQSAATPLAVQSSPSVSAQSSVQPEASTVIDKSSSAPTASHASTASPANSGTSAAIVAGEARADRTPIQIHAGHSENRIDPLLADAYQALLAGDLDGAQRKYQAVLQQEAGNRDGLLGMAAIAVRHNQMDQAERYYVKLLELDPLDPDATAGLLGMQQGDPAQSESRIKKVLAQHPQAGALWFALGNVYAQQSRWAEAQQAYFRAFGNQPENADYAFNLAVSLDRLNQDKLALEYYQQALKLVRAGQTNFSEASVQDRIGKLQSVLKN